MSTVVVREVTEPIVVLEKAQVPFVIELNKQGPQGTPGDAGFTAIAATAIGGHRIVTLNSDGSSMRIRRHRHTMARSSASRQAQQAWEAL